MFKIFIKNIIIGVLWGFFIATTLFISMNVRCSHIDYYSCLIEQSIIGFVLSLPVIVIMWKQTKKLNDKSILFLGGPVISISAALFFYFISNIFWPRMTKEAPYILLALVLFYCLVQLIMYYMATKKHVFRSILSVALGLGISTLLPIVTNQLVRTLDAFPQGSSELALVYRSVYIVLGSYITARFAPYASMRHTMILGIIMFLLSSFGTYGLIIVGISPIWYAYGVAIIVFPCVWLGNILYQRLHNKYKKYEHITQTKTTKIYGGFKIAVLLLLLIFISLILVPIIMTQDKDILCISSGKGPGSVEMNKCLEEYIPGYGGYYGIGKCKKVVYLTDPKHEETARVILLPILEYMEPLCKYRISLDFRKGQYRFSQLHLLSRKATTLLISEANKGTRIPGVSSMTRAPFRDNMIDCIVEKDDIIPQAKQVLREHNLTIEAFNFISKESELKAKVKALGPFSTAPEIQQSEGNEYVMVPAVKFGGMKAAELIMGKTSLSETLQLLPPYPGHGPKKSREKMDTKLPEEIKQVLRTVKKDYNPALTQTIVGFNQNKKVIFVQNIVEHEQAEKLNKDLNTITNMSEVYRDVTTIVKQGKLTSCVIVRSTAIIENNNEARVNSIAYFFTCETL